MALFDALKAIFTEPDRASGEEALDPMTQRVILLLETAGADFKREPEEAATIETLLRDRYGLSAAEIEELIPLAESHQAEMGDVYDVTRVLAKDMSIDERCALMTEIWEVIFADGRLDAHEEHFARKMGKLLRLDHPTWIKAKQAAKKDLSEHPDQDVEG